MFLALIVVPFWTSFLIRTYAFLIVLSPEFFLSDWLQSLKLTDGPLEILNTTAAIQIGLVYNYLPLFVLPLYATLERMDWRLVDAATDLGATQWAAFRQITLRLTAPGLVTGTLLVFIPMMGEYVIPLDPRRRPRRLHRQHDPAAVPGGAGLRARLGARRARDGARCRSSSRSTSTSRRARSRSTVPEPLRKLGHFLGALCFVSGLIAIVAFLIGLGERRRVRPLGARAGARRRRDRPGAAAGRPARRCSAATARWSTSSCSCRSSSW